MIRLLPLTAPFVPAEASGQRRLAFVLLVLGAMCIAMAPICVRLADVGPVSVVAWRLGLSIPFALAWWWRVRGAPAAQAPASGPWWLILAGVLLAADLALWHVAIHFTTVANSTFILNLAPIFVALGGALWLGERIAPRFVLAMLIALCGAALLVRASLQASPRELTGDAIALLAAIFYAGYQLAVKHCRRHYHTAHILAASAIVTPLVLLPVIWALGERAMPGSVQGWAAVIAIALVAQVLGQGLITWAVGHMRASLASLVLLVQPVTAAGIAAMLFNEWLHTFQLFGCILVLLGIAIARRAS